MIVLGYASDRDNKMSEAGSTGGSGIAVTIGEDVWEDRHADYEKTVTDCHARDGHGFCGDVAAAIGDGGRLEAGQAR